MIADKAILRVNIVQKEGMIVLHGGAKFEVSPARFLEGDYSDLLVELQGKRLLRGEIPDHYVVKNHPMFEIYDVGINGSPPYLQLTPSSRNEWGGPT